MVFDTKLKTLHILYYKKCLRSTLERYWPAFATNVKLSTTPVRYGSKQRSFCISYEDQSYGNYDRKGNSKEHYWIGYNAYEWHRSKNHYSNNYDGTQLWHRLAMIIPAVVITGNEIVESADAVQSKDISIDENKNIPNSSGQNSKIENELKSKEGINSESKTKLKNDKNNVKPETPSQTLPKQSKRWVKLPSRNMKLSTVISEAKNMISQKMLETGAPGISVAISIDGKNVWSDGFGYADLENNIRMAPDTVLRIASISKSITMAGVGKLVDEGKLDLDAPIQKYVPDFPVKIIDGQEVTITTRHLLSHTSGIRHYSLKEEIDLKSKKNNCQKKKKNCHNKAKRNENEENNSIGSNEAYPNKSAEKGLREKTVESAASTEIEKDSKHVVKEKRHQIKKLLCDKMFKDEKEHTAKSKGEFDLQEYYIKEHFNSVKEALELFKNDDLLFKPGESYSYTTHGYTLVSAVIEGASGISFTTFLKDLFKQLDLTKTYLDVNEDIIHKRSRYYYRNKRSVIKNVPYVDNSYKWAGGGILSTTEDLLKFGNIMLYSYQLTKEEEKDKVLQRGFLKKSTMNEMWKPVPNTKMDWDKHGSYALGWAVVEPEKEPAKYCEYRRFYVSHTGGAIGASSVLLILPMRNQVDKLSCRPVNGIVVAIIANMQNTAGLNELALDLAKLFNRVESDPKIVGSLNGNNRQNVYTLNDC